MRKTFVWAGPPNGHGSQERKPFVNFMANSPLFAVIAGSCNVHRRRYSLHRCTATRSQQLLIRLLSPAVLPLVAHGKHENHVERGRICGRTFFGFVQARVTRPTQPWAVADEVPEGGTFGPRQLFVTNGAATFEDSNS